MTIRICSIRTLRPVSRTTILGVDIKTWGETRDWAGVKTLILDEDLGVQCEGKDYPGKKSLSEGSLGKCAGQKGGWGEQ